MRPRGYALVVALVCVMLMTAGIILLTRATVGLVAARRSAALREAALRKAEDTLERGRVQVESGRLAAGQTTTLEGIPVACAGTPRGLRLEALVELARPMPPAGAKGSPGVRRGVRVAWELERAGEARWRRADWQARDETLLDAAGAGR
jgi:hypothetical protein